MFYGSGDNGSVADDVPVYQGASNGKSGVTLSQYFSNLCFEYKISLNDLIKKHTITQINLMAEHLPGHRNSFYRMLAYCSRAAQADAKGFKSFMRELD